MGKVRIKHLGIEELEIAEREKRRRQRDQKKKRERTPGLKGGERIVSMTQDEEVEKLAKITKKQKEISDELKKGTKQEEKEKKLKSIRKKRERSKSYRKAKMKIDQDRLYTIEDAVKLLKELSHTRFNSTIEAHINTKETGIRGTLTFPHSTGKKRRVAIATEELIEQVKQGNIDFDVLVSHPNIMSKIAKVAKILGPRGLMPNPKAGTISKKPEEVVRELESGKVEYKTESKHPIIHQSIGKVDLPSKSVVENYRALINAIGAHKIKSITIASTMSPGIRVKPTPDVERP